MRGAVVVLALVGCAWAASAAPHGLQAPGTSEDQWRECMDFLVQNMPPSDVHDDAVTAQFLARNVDLALSARQQNPWAEAVPWDMFLNNVLPYASLNEQRDEWRPLFASTFLPLVSQASNLTHAAFLLNKLIWGKWNITFVPDQTPFTMSPFQTIERHNASCTGLSIFLVDACRSVGIPARVAGTPHWNRPASDCPNGDSDPDCGNHDWVEIWDGEWQFTGAHEYNGKMNNTWFFPLPAQFQTPGTRNHSIFATSWNHTDAWFPMSWDWDSDTVPGVDVTQRYLDTALGLSV